jgi:hypothetical protein
MLRTSGSTVLPAGMSPGAHATIGTRIDSSYALRLSMSPCSPSMKPLSLM